MRIDKYLADNSIGTRKEIKGIIKAGRICVNGVTAFDPGMHIVPGKDIITMDERVIEYERFHYYMLNKPAGTVSSTREGASVTVVELLADENVKNLSPVGRLDKDTEGLLLLTDDGALLHDLISPSKHVEKEYLVQTEKPVSEADIKKLEEGVDIGDDSPTLPARAYEAEDGLHLIITEGRFHQVKRMLEAVLRFRHVRMRRRTGFILSLPKAGSIR